MIHTILVDDQESVLRGLRYDIKSLSYLTIDIVGEALDKKTVINLLKDAKKFPNIDLVITDLHFQNENHEQIDGLQIIDEVHRHRPKTKVLVITHDNETDWYDIVIEQKKADGILSKNFSVAELGAAIHTITQRQQPYFSQKVAFMLQQRQDVRKDSQEFRVSEKSLQVIRLASSGITREQIAEHLNCSKGYIDKIMNNLFRQFGVSNIAGLIKASMERGLL